MSANPFTGLPLSRAEKRRLWREAQKGQARVNRPHVHTDEATGEIIGFNRKQRKARGAK